MFPMMKILQLINVLRGDLSIEHVKGIPCYAIDGFDIHID